MCEGGGDIGTGRSEDVERGKGRWRRTLTRLFGVSSRERMHCSRNTYSSADHSHTSAHNGRCYCYAACMCVRVCICEPVFTSVRNKNRKRKRFGEGV